MYLIRSIAVAQSGRRDELAGVMKEFCADMPMFAAASPRVLTASVGPSDATVVMETQHPTLADFEARLEESNKSEKMAKYGPKFGELTVAGSHRFEIYRIR